MANNNIVLAISTLYKGEGMVKASKGVNDLARTVKNAGSGISGLMGSLGSLGGMVSKVTDGVGKLFGAFASGPAGLAILAIGGIVSAIDKWREHQQKLKEEHDALMATMQKGYETRIRQSADAHQKGVGEFGTGQLDTAKKFQEEQNKKIYRDKQQLNTQQESLKLQQENMRLQQEAYKYGENNEKAQYGKALKNREALIGVQSGTKMSSTMNITTLENELKSNESSLKMAQMTRDEIAKKKQELDELVSRNALKYQESIQRSIEREKEIRALEQELSLDDRSRLKGFVVETGEKGERLKQLKEEREIDKPFLTGFKKFQDKNLENSKKLGNDLARAVSSVNDLKQKIEINKATLENARYDKENNEPLRLQLQQQKADTEVEQARQRMVLAERREQDSYKSNNPNYYGEGLLGEIAQKFDQLNKDYEKSLKDEDKNKKLEKKNLELQKHNLEEQKKRTEQDGKLFLERMTKAFEESSRRVQRGMDIERQHSLGNPYEYQLDQNGNPRTFRGWQRANRFAARGDREEREDPAQQRYDRLVSRLQRGGRLNKQDQEFFNQYSQWLDAQQAPVRIEQITNGIKLTIDRIDNQIKNLGGK